MAYKINVNGVLIEADTLKEALALAKEIAPQPPKPIQPPAPAVAQVQATSPVPALSAQPPAAALPAQADVPPEFRMPRAYVSETAMTAAFLAKISEGSGDGVESKELMSIVGADHPRGFGAKVRPIKRVLADLGYQSAHDAFTWERSFRGKDSVWLPGPKLQEALAKAREAAGQK